MLTRRDVSVVLEGLGYTFEHDWQESHGNGGQWTFQAPRCDRTLILAYDREGNPTTLFPGEDRDYRLAKEIRSNPNDFHKIKETISRCCTSSVEIFEDCFGDRFQIFGAAGHGEWGKNLGNSKKIPLIHNDTLGLFVL